MKNETFIKEQRDTETYAGNEGKVAKQIENYFLGFYSCVNPSIL